MSERTLSKEESDLVAARLASRIDAQMTATIAGRPVGPSEPLTVVNMAQRILDALAPADHWHVRPDGLLPINVPVVVMTNDAGVREHHIGASAAMLMVTKRYCPFQVIDLDRGCWRSRFDNVFNTIYSPAAD